MTKPSFFHDPVPMEALDYARAALCSRTGIESPQDEPVWRRAQELLAFDTYWQDRFRALGRIRLSCSSAGSKDDYFRVWSEIHELLSDAAVDIEDPAAALRQQVSRLCFVRGLRGAKGHRIVWHHLEKLESTLEMDAVPA